MTTINNGGGVTNPRQAQQLQNLEKAEGADRDAFKDHAKEDDNGVKYWTQDQFTQLSSAANEKKKYTAQDFARADKNGDGKLTEEEFMKARGMDRLMRQINDDMSNWFMSKIMSQLGDALRGR